MALAKKCDKCGKMYEKYNEDYNSAEKNINGFATICVSPNGNNYIVQEVYDLCEECRDSLKEWFHPKDLEDNKVIIQEGQLCKKNGMS